MTAAFRVGDTVQPKPEWIDQGIPSGIVCAVAPWGEDGAFYVADDPRAYADYVFDRVLL